MHSELLFRELVRNSDCLKYSKLPSLPSHLLEKEENLQTVEERDNLGNENDVTKLWRCPLTSEDTRVCYYHTLILKSTQAQGLLCIFHSTFKAQISYLHASSLSPDSRALFRSASALFLSTSMPPVSCFTVSSISLRCSSWDWLSNRSLLLLPLMNVLGRAAADGRGLSFFSLPMLPRLKRQNTLFRRKNTLSPTYSNYKITLRLSRSMHSNFSHITSKVCGTNYTLNCIYINK